MYRGDPDELETMVEGIAAAIRKYSIPVDKLTDQQIWEELQRKGYNFPFRGKRYLDFLGEAAYWFDALHLAIERVKNSERS